MPRGWPLSSAPTYFALQTPPNLPPTSITREVAGTGAEPRVLPSLGRHRVWLGRESFSHIPPYPPPRLPTTSQGWKVADGPHRQKTSKKGTESLPEKFKQAPSPGSCTHHPPCALCGPSPSFSPLLRALPLPQPYLVQQGLVVTSPRRAGGADLHGRGAWAGCGGTVCGPLLQHRGQRPAPPSAPRTAPGPAYRSARSR